MWSKARRYSRLKWVGLSYPDAQSGRCRVELLGKHQFARVVQPKVLLELQWAHRGHRPEIVVQGRHGRSARVIVTMGMPAFVYRLWYLDHDVAGTRRGILNLVGIKKVREKRYGMVEGFSASKREQWIAEMRKLGASAFVMPLPETGKRACLGQARSGERS